MRLCIVRAKPEVASGWRVSWFVAAVEISIRWLYHPIDSLEPKELAECEDALVAHYRAALVRHGPSRRRPRPRAVPCALYFQTRVVALVSLGLGCLTEREETVRTVLRRSVAAVERLGFGDWLAGL